MLLCHIASYGGWGEKTRFETTSTGVQNLVIIRSPNSGRTRQDRIRTRITVRRSYIRECNDEDLGCEPISCADDWWVLSLGGSECIRFVIDREECFAHDVKYEGDTVHVSFVVIKSDSPWHYGDDGVDLMVKGPSGEQIQDYRDKSSEKFDFVAHHSGVHRFCFTNKSPYHETLDFDVHVAYFSYYDQHANDEHFAPLLEQIAKLEEALYNIQFEQHWFRG